MRAIRLVPMLVLLSLLTTFGALTSCVDQTLQALEPGFAIAWSPDRGYVPGDLSASVLNFGEVTTGTYRDITISMGNPGHADLEMCEVYFAVIAFDGEGAVINEVRIDSDPELGHSPLPGAGFLGAGASTNFDVRYTPLWGDPLDDGIHLVVKHELNWSCEDGGGSALNIPIAGTGWGNPVPDIMSKPEYVDFGTTLLTTPLPPQQVLVGNVGPGMLEVQGVTIDDNLNFHLETGALPGANLETGQHEFITVSYTPQWQGNHATNVWVSSNDADESPYPIPLFGSADPEQIPDPGDDDDATDDPPPPGFPIAICGGTLFANPLEVVTLSSASFHTGGFAETLALQYSWTLNPPPGSATTLANANTNSPSTSPYVDIVGSYVGQLTVTDSGGQTDDCTQTIEVLPPENFRIELYWDQQDDFDLHLLEANDGSGNQGQAFDSNSDCYFSNCQTLGLDWGVSGDTYDNPYLDLDDIPGTGPENINITDPALAPYDGWYQVMVHDYTGSTEDNEGTTNGTVNIYLNQVLQQTYSFSMSGDGDEYYVAKIHWPSGQIQVCNGLSGC
jgi:hypothetical protein